MTIALVEEDIAKLRYEVVYLQELMKTKKLTLNRLMKKFRRIDFSKMQVSRAYMDAWWWPGAEPCPPRVLIEKS